MAPLIIKLKGRNKKRLQEKLILYDKKIYKYRDNNLIYVRPNDNTTYYDFTLSKKSQKFYPVSEARLARIGKNRSTDSPHQQFIEFVTMLKKHPRLSAIRNGVHFDEKEQKLLLNIPRSRKATRVTTNNPNYTEDYYTSLEEYRKIIIDELTKAYREQNYKKVFIDTKSYMVYKPTQDSDISFTTIKDVRRGETGFERLCLNVDDIPRYVDDYFTMIELYCINSDFARHSNNGRSIYQFNNIAKTEFTIVKMKAQFGGCNMSVQPYMKFTASNIHYLDNRKDNKCFFWSLIAALNRSFDAFYIRRITFIDYYQKYYNDDKKYFNGLSLKDIDRIINVYPVDRDNISLFKELESQLNIRLQIIECDGTQDKYESCSVYYNGNLDNDRLIQLIYYTDCTQSAEGHWLPVVSEKNLRNILNNGKKWICPHCKRSYITKVAFTSHVKTCQETINKRYKLQPYHTFIRYRDFNKEMKCVVFGACDYETSFQRTDLYNTQECGEHVNLLPLMLKCYIKSDLKNLPPFNPDIYTADDPAFELKFLDDLYNYGQEYLKQVQLNIEAHTDKNTLLKHKNADQCFICGHKFGKLDSGEVCEIRDEYDLVNNYPEDDHRCYKTKNKFDIKCYHHNHQTGEYIGALCSRCNLQVSYKYLKIPIFFHNYAGFDCIFLRQAINRWNAKRAMLKLPTVPYKPLGISLDSDLFAKWGIFSFQDSCKLMPESLENLVENLKNGNGNFSCTEEYARSICESNPEQTLETVMETLTKKQIFPYSLITDMFSFRNKKGHLLGIPKKDVCKDYLNETTYTKAEYNELVKTAKILNLKSLLDIYKNYLECDVRLLIDVLDNFSKTMIKSYTLEPVNGNDPLWFYTISSYCRSMSTKYAEAARTGIIKVDFDNNKLLWDVKKIEDAKKCLQRFKNSQGIRLLNYGEDELYQFVNDSIVGGISFSLNKYANVNTGVHIEGYDCSSMYSRCLCEFLPFDLRFTDKFKTVEAVNKHLEKCCDSDYIQYMFEVDVDIDKNNKLIQQFPPIPTKEQTLSGQIKLNCTLRNKYKVIIHQNALKQYIQLGCTIKEVYRVVELVCAPVYYPFIHRSLELRSQSRSVFESNLYKLCCNSLFGSSIMNSANYSTIKYVTDEQQIERLFNKVFNIANVEMNEIDGSLRISLQQQKTCSTPRVIGSTVLHYSKKLLYDFWYNYIMKVFENPKLNFIETDSIYFNYTKKITTDLDKQYIGRLAGQFKPEHKDITELVTLRSKMYSYKTPDGETKRAKGIKKQYVDNSVTFDDYMEILNSNEDVSKIATYNLIQHNQSSVTINRVSKKMFAREYGLVDDKVIVIDKYTSKPLG